MTLILQDVHAHYGLSHVLHGVSLDVREGQVTTILGRNGAGKTTLLLTIMGYLSPAPGRVSYAGQEIGREPPYRIARRGIGFVPQERGIFRSLSVRENLTVAERAPRAAPGAAQRWSLQEVYRLFPRLAERERNYGNQLSGGEQQMLSIARALMLNPSLLILDEPSEGLAPMLVKEIQNTLVSLKRDGLSILLVEQNLRLALDVGDTHHVLSKGRVHFTGTTRDLEHNEGVLKKYLAV